MGYMEEYSVNTRGGVPPSGDDVRVCLRAPAPTVLSVDPFPLYKPLSCCVYLLETRHRTL